MGLLSKNGLGDRPNFPDRQRWSKERKVIELGVEPSGSIPSMRKVFMMPRKDWNFNDRLTEHKLNGMP